VVPENVGGGDHPRDACDAVRGAAIGLKVGMNYQPPMEDPEEMERTCSVCMLMDGDSEEARVLAVMAGSPGAEAANGSRNLQEADEDPRSVERRGLPTDRQRSRPSSNER
jgi:hypothetical protein